MSPTWQQILINWAPLFVMLGGIWAVIFLPMRRAVARARETTANQLAETKRQNDALERIATALEKLKP
jgi:hypothetical protein